MYYGNIVESCFGLVYWWFYVTENDISVIDVTAYTRRCAGGLKKKVDLRLPKKEVV